MFLQPRNLLLILLILPTLATPRLLTEEDTPSSPSILLITLLIILFLLTALYCYDRRQNFHWLTTIRHSIGECVRRVRHYRRRSMDKSMRIETEEVLPTPKTSHIEPENQRPFIQSEPSVREPISPSDPIGHEQLQERKEVDLKNVFQQKEHKGGSKGGKTKPKKEKKSKSKLKSRLQSTAGNQEEKEGSGQEEENSFSQEIDMPVGNGVEEVAARGSEVQ